VLPARSISALATRVRAEAFLLQLFLRSPRDFGKPWPDERHHVRAQARCQTTGPASLKV
jgi:hypothetical protein